MKIIKISSPEPGYPLYGHNSPLRQSKGALGIWGDYKFIINQDLTECDYWVVFDQIQKTETCMCHPQNTIFITGEPPQISYYPHTFLDQFSNIITCHSNIIQNITNKKIFKSIQGHQWFVNKTYDELNAMHVIDKSKHISLITTKKYKKRYGAALQLKEHFGDKLDLFGEGHNPINDKWDALYPYKYTIVMENFRNNDWITEKLFDSYLAQTYPFYYGCPNVKDYYEKESYIEIDINDIDETISRIETTINNQNHYIRAQPYLETAKRLTMDQYNIFPLIIRSINLLHLNETEPKIKITLSDKNRFWKNNMMFLKKLMVT